MLNKTLPKCLAFCKGRWQGDHSASLSGICDTWVLKHIAKTQKEIQLILTSLFQGLTVILPVAVSSEVNNIIYF